MIAKGKKRSGIKKKRTEREREVGRWSLCDIRVVVLSACERAVWYK